MKKKIEEEVKQNASTSFSEMNDNEMDSLLYQLYDTPYWQAIMRFNRLSHNSVSSVLASVDPFKEPTKAARAQGQGAGLFILESKVNNLVEKNKDK